MSRWEGWNISQQEQIKLESKKMKSYELKNSFSLFGDETSRNGYLTNQVKERIKRPNVGMRGVWKIKEEDDGIRASYDGHRIDLLE